MARPRTKWEKPKDDNFVTDMKKASAQAIKASELTERNLRGIVDESTGIKAQKIPLHLLEDAPHDWNIYRDIRNDAKLFNDMKNSILEEGLIQPIVVWEKENKDGYYILAGHSRTRVYEFLYKEQGLEEYGEIYSFVRPYESLDKAKAIGLITGSNISRGELKESERILEEGLLVEAAEVKAEKIFYENPGKYERVRDVVGEMLGRKDGKDVDNIKMLCTYPREVLELIDTTPLSKTHLLNPVMREEEVQHTLLSYKENITKDFVSMIQPGIEKEDIKKGLVEGVIKPRPDTVIVTVPDGTGKYVEDLIKKYFEMEGYDKEDYTVRVKGKRKKTPAVSSEL